MSQSIGLASMKIVGWCLLVCFHLYADGQDPPDFDPRLFLGVNNCSVEGLWDVTGMMVRDFFLQQEAHSQNLVLIQSGAETLRQSILHHLSKDVHQIIEYELSDRLQSQVVNIRERLDPTKEYVVITVMNATSTGQVLEMANALPRDGRRCHWLMVLTSGNIDDVSDVMRPSGDMTVIDVTSGGPCAANIIFSHGSHPDDKGREEKKESQCGRDIVGKILSNVQVNVSEAESGIGINVYRSYASEDLSAGTEKRNMTLLGRWTGFGSVHLQFVPTFEETDFHGVEFIVTSIDHPPFQIRQPYVGIQGHHFTGISFEILDSLASSLNFSYHVIYPNKESYGTFEDGKWNGMMEMLVNKEADIGVGAFSVTKKRSEYVDFLWTFWEEPSTFLITVPTTYTFGSVFRPFKIVVWLCLAAAIPLISLFIWGFTRVNPREKKSSYNTDITSCIYDTFGSIWHQGSNVVPYSHSSRILSVHWWLFGVIITALYTANLVAFLSVQKVALPINTLEKLAADSRYGIVMEKGTALEQLMMDSNRTPYSTLRRTFTQNPVFRNPNVTADELLELASSGKVAFLEELTLAKLYAQEHCHLSISDERFFKANLAFPVRKGFAYTNIFNTKIMQMIEAGLILKWTEQHWPNDHYCVQTNDEATTVSMEHKVTFLETRGAWNLFAIGLAGAILSLLFECSWEKYSKYKRYQNSTSNPT